MHVVHDSEIAVAVWDGSQQILGSTCEPPEKSPQEKRLHALGHRDAEQVQAD
jgi:hypothetical protein